MAPVYSRAHATRRAGGGRGSSSASRRVDACSCGSCLFGLSSLALLRTYRLAAALRCSAGRARTRAARRALEAVLGGAERLVDAPRIGHALRERVRPVGVALAREHVGVRHGRVDGRLCGADVGALLGDELLGGRLQARPCARPAASVAAPGMGTATPTGPAYATPVSSIWRSVGGAAAAGSRAAARRAPRAPGWRRASQAAAAAWSRRGRLTARRRRRAGRGC